MQTFRATYRTTMTLSAMTFPRPPLKRPGKIALSLAAVLSLSACAGQMGGGPLTPAQQQLHDANDRFVATTAEGAAAGAVLGALVGFAAGGARGALIGGIGGAAAGTLVGYSVAQNNLNQSHTEANMQALIQQANDDASAYERSANASAQIASDLRNEIASLDQQYAAHSVSASAYQAKLASYRKSADTMRQQIADMQKESNMLSTDSASYGDDHRTELNNLVGRIDAARKSEELSLQAVDQAMSAVPG